ncbi:hypothetical protein NM688_g2969 [Phlebia brevispora]|uniref:Uncharacterized protein n=1 Tax=Phlebia brevispora TaxID=194682 RepID=A0ACC1T7R5_9APHY|nr:hypothetical protein NM688_g2969 [Phlebia brevispora]
MSPTLPTRTSTLTTTPPSTKALYHSTKTVFPRSQSVSIEDDFVSASSCCQPTPTAVVLDIHTRLVIPNYHLYYSAPIASFRPDYHALSDGSLVATPLIVDIRSANIELSLTSALGMFFLITTVISIQYLWKGKIKKKVLFYILTASQVLGLVTSVMLIIPFFNQFISCTSVGLTVIIGAMLSYSLLMTGILGIKAYRCLNNSRLVLAVLVTLRTAMLILMVLDITKYRASRRLSGGCMPAVNFTLMPVIIILQSAESAFICICYLVAVWGYSRTSVEQGRMSINLSLDKTSNIADRDAADEEPTRRGWWDYVPEVPRSEQAPRRSVAHSRTTSEHAGFMHYVNSKFHGLWKYPPTDGPSLHRKPSLPGDKPLRQLPRTSVTFSINRAGQLARSATKPADQRGQLRAQNLGVPTSPSAMSRLSKYMPRMQLFRQVLKNELYYTALVTAIYVVLAILMLVGMSGQFGMSPVGWIVVSWFVVSLFTMHSFSRVVRRHEHEAILQHPTAWDPVYRAELEASRAFNGGRRGRMYSPVSVASRRPKRTRPPDPFEDPRIGSADDMTDSLSVPAIYADEDAGHLPDVRPWATVSRDLSSSSEASYEDSLEIHIDRLYTRSQWGEVEMLPSPAPSDYPYPQSASVSACPPSPYSGEDVSIVQPMTAPADVSSHRNRRSKHFVSSRTPS